VKIITSRLDHREDRMSGIVDTVKKLWLSVSNKEKENTFMTQCSRTQGHNQKTKPKNPFGTRRS
jgi:hypothetical protein